MASRFNLSIFVNLGMFATALLSKKLRANSNWALPGNLGLIRSCFMSMTIPIALNLSSLVEGKVFSLTALAGLAGDIQELLNLFSSRVVRHGMDILERSENAEKRASAAKWKAEFNIGDGPDYATVAAMAASIINAHRDLDPALRQAIEAVASAKPVWIEDLKQLHEQMCNALDDFFCTAPCAPSNLPLVVETPRLDVVLKEKPGWPPLEWESPVMSAEPSKEGLRQWFIFLTDLHGVLRALRHESCARFVAKYVRDTLRLIRNVAGKGLIDMPTLPTLDTSTADTAFAVLTKLKEQIFPPPQLQGTGNECAPEQCASGKEGKSPWGQIGAEELKDAGDPGAVELTSSRLKKLSPSRIRAYQQYLSAIRRNPALRDATDKAAYVWLRFEDQETEEELPPFDTWWKYVREARKAAGTNKHISRHGRTGRNVVRSGEK